ncbi:MAG: thiosulfate oxidation carrier protein SoxY [Proteobacteria bacterium]|jgi:sulfur-oxidizing protein SoxY|nr:thiosulfate oxidation carrier protein SoxY [Pseudomonadota bacterium]
MNSLRRILLKSAGASGTLGLLIAAGLLKPTRVLASDWNRAAFTATTASDSLKAYGTPNPVEHREILISAAEIAENGAQVPIEVHSRIPGSQTIAVFVDRNPMPLAASMSFANGALPYVRLQLKMAETSRVRAVVRTSDGKAYHASREIKVTLGGCGG